MNASRSSKLARALLATLTIALACSLGPQLTLAAHNTAYNGALPDGAVYLIEVPPSWNGTLVLYSHGYRFEGSENPAADAGDSKTAGSLLKNGYALAGSSYRTLGFAVKEAVPDQIAVLDLFPKPHRQKPQANDSMGSLAGWAGHSHADRASPRNAAPRIAADPGAVAYLTRYTIPSGHLPFPILTMHTIGDGLVVVEQEHSYRTAAESHVDGALLRQVFVSRASHCTFTSAETIKAFKKLEERLTTGTWGDLSPKEMNAGANKLLGYNTRRTI